MSWTITRIDEADYGCEERMPGEPLMVLVSLESENLQMIQFEVADHWLELQGLDVGDEWPEDLDIAGPNDGNYEKQAQWMQNYIDALSEIGNM